MRLIKKLAELFVSKPEQQAQLKHEHAESSCCSSGSFAPLVWKKPGEQAREARASLQHAGPGAREGLTNAAKWACPSQQSSAAQTPYSTRPSSKEHQRSSLGSDTLSERDEQEAQQRGPQEGKDSLDRTDRASPPKPAVSSTWFTHSSELAQRQQQQRRQQVSRRGHAFQYVHVGGHACQQPVCSVRSHMVRPCHQQSSQCARLCWSSTCCAKRLFTCVLQAGRALKPVRHVTVTCPLITPLACTLTTACACMHTCACHTHMRASLHLHCCNRYARTCERMHTLAH